MKTDPPSPSYPSPGLWVRQSAADVRALFARQLRVDPLGRRLHLLAAALACLFAGFPTAFVTFAWIPLACVFIVRMFSHHKVLSPLWFDPLVRLLLLWVVFLSLSLLWSPDPRAGLDELGALIPALFVPFLYPVLDRRLLLLLCILLGCLLGNLSQLFHSLALALDLHSLAFNRLPGRNSGWWDPVVAGSLLTAALAANLSLLCLSLKPRPPLHSIPIFLSLPATLLSLLGLLLTGTRGAWIAVALLLLLAAPLFFSLLHRSQSPSAPRHLLKPALLLLLPLLLIATLFLASPSLWSRVRLARAELSAALDRADYSSDTARRILMARWAFEAWSSHPILGVGLGGYHAYVQSHSQISLDHASPAAQRIRADAGPLALAVHHHAHSTPLHLLATTGLLGFALFSALALRSLLAARFALHPSPFDLAPALALLGLLLAGLFDSITVNQQTANLAFLLIALLVPSRPDDLAT